MACINEWNDFLFFFFLFEKKVLQKSSSTYSFISFQVLVEKLLRSCSDCKNIYLLLRCKKGLDARARLEELVNAKVAFVFLFCLLFSTHIITVSWESVIFLSYSLYTLFHFNSFKIVKAFFQFIHKACFLFADIWKDSWGVPKSIEQISRRPRRHHSSRFGHFRKRYDSVSTRCVHRFPLGRHRQIWRAAQVIEKINTHTQFMLIILFIFEIECKLKAFF